MRGHISAGEHIWNRGNAHGKRCQVRCLPTRCYAVSGTELAHAAMWCPVLTERMLLPDQHGGEEPWYPPTPLLRSTDLACTDTALRACYAVHCASICCRPTRLLRDGRH
eukprot:3704936-Rhodomonas_salina.1